VPEPRTPSRWYLFIHELPPQPIYLRAKVRTLLSRAGALALKDSVYVLPPGLDRQSQLHEIADVAKTGGGSAFLWQGEFAEGPGDDELIQAFSNARDREYADLVEQVGRWTDELHRRGRQTLPLGRLRVRLSHAKRRFSQVARRDFFGAPGRVQAKRALEELEARLQPSRTDATISKPPHPELMGRTWVTRRGIQVDRIASAWLVRRFIDPDARFRFINIHEERAAENELTFDMMDADFTHEEDRCTFETLVRRLGLGDAPLARVAEIIHDIDIKDGKFARPEARGVEQLVLGLLAANLEDDRRLERGFAMMDDLYRSFGGELPPDSSRKPHGNRKRGSE
jgi:hypothetical protein